MKKDSCNGVVLKEMRDNRYARKGSDVFAQELLNSSIEENEFKEYIKIFSKFLSFVNVDY
jgi:hypothetical protein